MTNRREFLRIGIATGAWPLASRAAFAAAAPASPVPLHKVVYDARFGDSVAFAKRARELGMPVHEIEGDITALWYHELDSRWRHRAASDEPVAVAGLTAHGALFCLERLAWDQRMRVVFRAEHAAAESGSIEHRLEGPLGMLQAALGLEAAGRRWAPRMADVIADCPQGRIEISKARVAAAGAEPGAEALYTWVIAPAGRA
jgi:hypothetical protein